MIFQDDHDVKNSFSKDEYLLDSIVVGGSPKFPKVVVSPFVPRFNERPTRSKDYTLHHSIRHGFSGVSKVFEQWCLLCLIHHNKTIPQIFYKFRRPVFLERVRHTRFSFNPKSRGSPVLHRPSTLFLF